MTNEEYEGRVRELVGSTLTAVFYFEIDYRNEAGEPLHKPSWNLDSRFDSLDFGLELRTRESDAFWISWGHEFFQFDIEIERNTTDDRSRMRMWDVSRESRWHLLLGKRVLEVETHWSWVDVSSEEGARRIRFPQDLRISFETGETVYISALEVLENGRPHVFADNVMVFFDEATAKQYNIGPYART